jgi:hypothetical protein
MSHLQLATIAAKTPLTTIPVPFAASRAGQLVTTMILGHECVSVQPSSTVAAAWQILDRAHSVVVGMR